MHYLTLPAGKLYYMQPSEAFFTYLKVAVAAGFLIALPVIFYQVWRFFLPAPRGRAKSPGVRFRCLRMPVFFRRFPRSVFSIGKEFP